MTEPAVSKTALDSRVSGALTRYRVMAIITGTFLIAVFAGLILKQFVDNPTLDNVTVVIATAHGWIYVIYLAATVNLWLVMRWGFGRLIVMALGGIIPGLSFVLEHRFAVEARTATPGNLEP